MKVLNILFCLLMWFLWVTWVSALPMYWTYLVSDGDQVDSLTPLSWFAVIMYLWPVALTTVLRWIVIPRIKIYPLTIIPFFFGTMFAMSLALYGIFLFEEFLTIFFVTSCLAVLQFIPLFHINGLTSPFMHSAKANA